MRIKQVLTCEFSVFTAVVLLVATAGCAKSCTRGQVHRDELKTLDLCLQGAQSLDSDGTICKWGRTQRTGVWSTWEFQGGLPDPGAESPKRVTANKEGWELGQSHRDKKAQYVKGHLQF